MNQALGFILIPIYSVYLSTEDYGILSAMTLFISLISIIITLSLDRSIYRCYYDYNNEDDQRVFLGTIIIGLFGVSLLFSALIILLSKYVGLIFSSIPFFPYYLLALSILYLSNLYKVTIIYYRLTEQSKKYVLFSLGYFLFNSFLIIASVVFLRQGAVGKLYANLITNLVFFFIAFYAIKKNVVFKFDYTMFKSALIYSLPIIPNLLSAFILNVSDRIFIEKYIDLKSLGIYSLGYQLAGGLAVIGGAFYGAYNPMFFRIANSEKEKKGYLKIVQDNYHLIIIFLHFLALLFAEELFILLIDSKFHESYQIFQLTLLAYLITSIFDVLGLSFSQDKKMSVLMNVVIIGALINILLNYYLIPIYGMYGASYATIISFLIMGLVKYYFARNYYFIAWDLKGMLSFLLILSSLYLLSFTINYESMFRGILLKGAASSFVGVYMYHKVKNSIKLFRT